jgi:hypothetical protein
MKWIKHDTDANQDAKLQNVMLDYGLEGYGLYWYCIELIAGRVDKENITFELEHDARIIARNTGSTATKVEEMMRYFVKIDLFEDIGGVITCMKLAKRLDKSMTSNPEMRSLIESMRSHDKVMTPSAKPMQDKTRSDKNRIDKDTIVPAAQKREKFSEGDMAFVDGMLNLLLQNNPRFKQPNKNTWANDVRKIREIDGIDHTEMAEVFTWANNDSFWSSNILSPIKLRKQWNALKAKMSKPKQADQSDDWDDPDWHRDLGK